MANRKYDNCEKCGSWKIPCKCNIRTHRYLLTYYVGKNFAGDILHADKLIRDYDDLIKTLYYLIDVGEILLPTKLSVWDYERKCTVINFNTN